MEFGVMGSSSWGPKRLMETGSLAEELGFEFFLVSDHYLTPAANTSVDSWTFLAGLAVRTKKIRIGTCVTPIPFRPPGMLAKMVSTVDHLSDGRTILGVGAGWHKPEFEAYSSWDEDSVRVAKTKEGIELIMKLWTSKEPFDFAGRYYSAKGAILEPKPVQKPHPPLWFGTGGSRMLDLARKYASGWVPPVPAIDLATYEMVVSALKGRPVKVMFNGTAEEIEKGIEGFINMGCKGAILARVSYEELSAAMRHVAREIAPSYR